MIELKICMGTACHLRGSREIIEKIQALICANNIKSKVNLSGKFCLEQCANKGVSVEVDGKEFDVMPSEVEEFFTKEIIGRTK